MADAYLGEIRLFAGSFAPLNWLFCNGQSLPVLQYQALYSIIGNSYGGDSQNFKLPNLTGSVPIGAGNGPGLTPRTLGQPTGTAAVSLTPNQLPSHIHTAVAQNSSQGLSNPSNHYWATLTSGRPPAPKALYSDNISALQPLNPAALLPAGSNQPHNNMQPYVAIYYIICVEQGEYPVRPD